MNNLFDTLKRKADMWTYATDQKTGWLKAWHVIIFILSILSALSFVTTFITVMSGKISNVFNLVAPAQILIQTVLLGATFYMMSKCDKRGFIMNVILNGWYIFAQLVSVINALVSKDYFTSLIEQQMGTFAADEVQAMELLNVSIESLAQLTMVCTVFSSIIAMGLYGLNLAYILKRKAFFDTDFDSLQKMSDEKTQTFH